MSGKMNLLLLISNAFINTMGITQPPPQTAKRAAWFIVAMLSAVVAAIGTIAFLAIHWASHH
jgi:ABC-type amino acid transport system permease subunit